ncbi:hypothetical protein ACFV1L_09790 [Kitasatospora sp. NPDC059646]|uniref:hypothetical protein n=1 Tax=Kitasatospora sp. NPDC059646 TaxID=3346893 RepID=UPI00369DCC92
MTERKRPLHDMGGAIGPADTAGGHDEKGDRVPAPIGKGDTPNVAGSDEQQPEIAEGPVPGTTPEESGDSGGDGDGDGGDGGSVTRQEPDPPGPPRATEREIPPDAVQDAPAAIDPDRARPADPGAAPEDEGLPDLADGSPTAARASDPQRPPVPGDRPVAAESYGVTGDEQARGESLDAKLAAERPDVTGAGTGEPDDPAGQIALSDPRTDLRGEESGPRPGLSAEEEAVRVRSEEAED